jgi:hypothetical protein
MGRLRRHLVWAPLVLATALLAQRTIGGILTKVGHPGATLDDAYIHFQYARAIAEGHPFRFQAGEPISTGATSFLWPALLAPFYAIGFKGEAILWPAWVISFVALGALAYEAYRLARPLAGGAAAVGAGAMVLAFGGHAWCAASGMEVVPFAWLVAFATRRASEWAEGGDAVRTRRALEILLALAATGPLMRPEGALTALALGVVVAAYPQRRGIVVRGVDVSRIEAVAFVIAALLPNLFLFAMTGHATSSTAQVKLLAYSPYYATSDAAIANVQTLVGTILNGEVWSAEFLPKGGAPIACTGLACIAWRAHSTRLRVRGALILLLALTMFVPCLYVTFLWNRLRYLWPFATGWFVGLACLARVIAGLASRVAPRAPAATAALVAGGFAGSMLVRLDWVLEDAAQSASGIDRQQATLGRWANANLPRDARIGVNDTGAIAYFGNRRTFDVVGLTTPTEGRYWIAGSGSRLEHYEKLYSTAPSQLPTHFIVYPEWMACDPVIGRPLHEATVTDSTILGGQTMRVSEADFSLLGSGERPWSPLGVIDDAVDVADLESEAAHRYELLGAHEGEQTAEAGVDPDGHNVVDGGRTSRMRDRFFVHLPTAERLRGIARVETSQSATLHIKLAGKEVAPLTVEAGSWEEVGFDLPPDVHGDVDVDVTSDVPFTSFHYWFGRP